MLEKAQQLLKQLRRDLLADKRKTIVLGVLSLVLIGVVVKTVFSGSAPERVTAEAPKAAKKRKSATAASPSTQPLTRPIPQRDSSSDKRTVNNWTPSFHDSGGFDLQGDPNETVSVAAIPRRLSRDPFTSPAWHKFSIHIPLSATTVKVANGDEPPGMWDQLRSSLSDYQKRRQEERALVEEQLKTMKLQSTVTGVRPMAYISGRLIYEGDRISGFSVLRIEDRRVVLEKSGMTHVLVMP